MENLVQVKRTFNLRSGEQVDIAPVTIADHMWCQQTFGMTIGEKILKAKENDPSHALILIYNQVSPEQRQLFKSESHESFDEDGEPITVKIGGWKKMGKLFAEGAYEAALEGYTQALKDGYPALKKVDGESAEKKK